MESYNHSSEMKNTLQNNSTQPLLKSNSVFNSVKNQKLTIDHSCIALIDTDKVVQHILMEGVYPIHSLEPKISNQDQIHFINLDPFECLFGTQSPVSFLDQKIGLTKIMFFGSATLCVRFPKKLLAYQSSFSIESAEKHLMYLIYSNASKMLTAFSCFADILKRKEELEKNIKQVCSDELQKIGLKILTIQIQKVTLPESDYQHNTVATKMMELQKLYHDNLILEKDYKKQKDMLLKNLK